MNFVSIVNDKQEDCTDLYAVLMCKNRRHISDS